MEQESSRLRHERERELGEVAWRSMSGVDGSLYDLDIAEKDQISGEIQCNLAGLAASFAFPRQTDGAILPI